MAARLGIGTAAFASGYGIGSSDLPRAEAVALLRAGVSAGIAYIDTAPAYGDAELIIGDLAELFAERDVRVCTKISPSALTMGSATASARASLDRLRMPSVDTIMIHNADSGILQSGESAAQLQQLVGSGLALRAGASTYGEADAKVAAETTWCSAIQVEHSILNPSVIQALTLARPDVEIIARSVLCKGILTDRRHSPQAPAEELADSIEQLEGLAAEWGGSLPELAIRFALDSPEVSVVIVGVSSASELETALRAAAMPPLAPTDMSALGAFDRSETDAAHPERWSRRAQETRSP